MELTLDSIRNISLYQARKGYRFSMDAILLCSFINAARAEHIADLGAGSGIIGLLLAEKYPQASVTLFEIQDTLAALAGKNIALNYLEDRVKVVRADLRNIKEQADVSPHYYDLIASNPPFRKELSGHVNPYEEKAIARHEIKFRLSELAEAAACLLKPGGKFFFIHLPERLSEIINALRERRLEIKRLRFVHSEASSGAKLVMAEAVKGGRPGLKVESPFYIYNKGGTYTAEMKKAY